MLGRNGAFIWKTIPLTRVSEKTVSMNLVHISCRTKNEAINVFQLINYFNAFFAWEIMKTILCHTNEHINTQLITTRAAHQERSIWTCCNWELCWGLRFLLYKPKTWKLRVLWKLDLIKSLIYNKKLIILIRLHLFCMVNKEAIQCVINLKDRKNTHYKSLMETNSDIWMRKFASVASFLYESRYKSNRLESNKNINIHINLSYNIIYI